MTTTERDEVREKFAAEPGKGHLAEHSLAERANLRVHGGDTARPDKILAGLGHVPADTREKAAADRREAAKSGDAAKAGDGEKAAESGDADPKRTPPAGRSATPPAKAATTGRGKPVT